MSGWDDTFRRQGYTLAGHPDIRCCPDHPGHALNPQADGRWLCTSGHVLPSDLPTIRDDEDRIGDALEAT